MKGKAQVFQASFLAIVFLGVLAATGPGPFELSRNPKPGPKSQQQSEQELTPLIHSVEGPELFRAYCASCHGLDGKGHGPAAEALKAKPADLTALTKNSGGQFPEARVRSTVTGEEVLAAHGSREMPIWGPVFHQIEADVDRGQVRLENLVKYLESIQTVATAGAQPSPKAPSTNPSGAELFRQDCVVCHARDASAGPVPSPFRTPPDLTALTQRHGGNFPESYVRQVLRNGVKMPAHGPAEMPIWGADFAAKDKLTENQVALRIASLTGYLKSIQTK